MFEINNLKRQKKQKKNSFNRIKSPLTFSALRYGSLFVKSLYFCKLTQKQLECLYYMLNRCVKKLGKIITLIRPFIPITKKPTENRMGKGKGSIHSWIFKLRPGSIIFEILVRHPKYMMLQLKKLRHKSPIALKIQ